VTVTASNNNGWAVATSDATAVVAPLPAPAPPPSTVAPASTGLPVITGSAVVGQSLSASTGSWSGSPTGYAYQWRRCDSSGGACANLGGATAASYPLSSSDLGFTLRVVVTASNGGGSSTATSAASPVVASAAAGTITYPASFFTGPAGSGNILPTKQGAFLGVWPGKSETLADQTQHLNNDAAYFGRKLDIYHIHYGVWSPDTCFVTSGATDYQPVVSGKENWAVNNGMIPLVSWTPDYYVDQITSGQADACLISFAQRYAAWGKRFMLRMYWEFNGYWEKWSKNSNGTLATAAQQIAMWRHTVDVMRNAGMTNASWVWAPDEGGWGRDIAQASYPGDSYVDWVASDAYNWNDPSAWCGTHGGWCSFSDIFHHGQTGTSATGVEVSFRGRKPYMVAETGTMEDPNTAGRKGQWMTAMRDSVKSDFPDLYAIVYMDIDYSATGGPDWALNTSASSLDGFKALATDPYFITR
jgi:hypothetical protein